MKTNRKKGIGFIAGGLATFLIIPYLFRLIGIYFLPGFIYFLIAIVLIGIGVKFLLNKKSFDNETDEFSEYDNINEASNFSQQIKTSNMNKIINVNLTGGIIGLVGDSPQNSLNRRIKKENQNGWKVIQVIPSSSGNILLIVFRLLLLILTLFFYTTANGYYVIMEKKE